ncbi:SUMF1/EgtB/PvdO family nonheme iron enzyme [Myxococcota bacterium]|nr:SUMF1/EgtB/PvdO family nonheme iron enzyme [Myxococcota bacterium]
MPVGGTPVGGDPVGGTPVGGHPVGGTPVGGDPVGGAGGVPVGGHPVGGAPVGGDPTGGSGGTGGEPPPPCPDTDGDGQPGAPETCNGLDDDCNGALDEGFGVGDVCDVGVGACLASGHVVCLADGSAACDVAAGDGSGELCNGLDDDCNGVTDDLPGLGDGCSTGVGACRGEGHIVCDLGGERPICNAVEGAPGVETCDGVDNDCDDAVDDGFDLGARCETGLGACRAEGVLVCAGDGRAECSATPGVASEELCDGVDNDCDGTSDEGFPIGASCTLGEGACRAEGAVVCLPDGSAGCDAREGAPVAESCDGVDNDCDGDTDEDCRCLSNGSFEVGLSDWSTADTSIDSCGAPSGSVAVVGGRAELRAHHGYGQARMDQDFAAPLVIRSLAFHSELHATGCASAYVQVFRGDGTGVGFKMQSEDDRRTRAGEMTEFVEGNGRTQTRMAAPPNALAFDINVPNANGDYRLDFHPLTGTVDVTKDGVRLGQFSMAGEGAFSGIEVLVENSCCDGRNDAAFLIDDIVIEGAAAECAQAGFVPACPAALAAVGGCPWIYVPGGRGPMGGASQGRDNQLPAHDVTVPDFLLWRTEVTVAQYRACVDAGVCRAPRQDGGCNYGVAGREDHPVNCVTWSQARTFSQWVGGDLPTEAAWEFAARSGGRDQSQPWGGEQPSCDLAVIDPVGAGTPSPNDGCGQQRTDVVCSRPRGNSAQGACDLIGNVWEWTLDYGHDDYEGGPVDGSAWLEPPTNTRVLRGSSWNDDISVTASALTRYPVDPNLNHPYYGFRPALFTPACGVEICDLQDNDCDGQVDEGFPSEAFNRPDGSVIGAEWRTDRGNWAIQAGRACGEGNNAGPTQDPSIARTFQNLATFDVRVNVRIDHPDVRPVLAVNATEDRVGNERFGNGFALMYLADSGDARLYRMGQMVATVRVPEVRLAQRVATLRLTYDGQTLAGFVHSVGDAPAAPTLSTAAAPVPVGDRVGLGANIAGDVLRRLCFDDLVVPGAECTPGECGPEVCNGADDDCDGQIDEAPPEVACVPEMGLFYRRGSVNQATLAEAMAECSGEWRIPTIVELRGATDGCVNTEAGGTCEADLVCQGACGPVEGEGCVCDDRTPGCHWVFPDQACGEFTYVWSSTPADGNNHWISGWANVGGSVGAIDRGFANGDVVCVSDAL